MHLVPVDKYNKIFNKAILCQLGNIETVDFNNRLIKMVDFNHFNKFQYRELTTERLSKSVNVKNVKNGRHQFSFFFAQNGFLT